MNQELRPVHKMKGQGVGDIGPIAIAITVGIIVVAIGAVVLSEMTTTTLENTAVADETQNSTGTQPETITADNIGLGVVSGSESIAIFDFDSGTVTALTRDTNYSVTSYPSGTFNMTTVPGANITADQYRMNYTYLRTTNASTVMNSGLAAMITFSNFFGVIVIVSIAVIVLSLVMLLNRFQGRGGGA